MLRFLLASAMSIALIGSTQAATYTYLCRDHNVLLRRRPSCLIWWGGEDIGV